MSDTMPSLFPLHLLALDIIGTVLLAAGVAEFFTQAGFVPEWFMFPYYEYVLMAAGVVLMLPLIVNIVYVRKNASASSVR